MNRSETDYLSTLACSTGLTLLAVFFVSTWLDRPVPAWLPMLITSIAGFELFMMIDAFRKRRAGGGTNG